MMIRQKLIYFDKFILMIFVANNMTFLTITKILSMNHKYLSPI